MRRGRVGYLGIGAPQHRFPTPSEPRIPDLGRKKKRPSGSEENPAGLSLGPSALVSRGCESRFPKQRELWKLTLEDAPLLASLPSCID